MMNIDKLEFPRNIAEEIGLSPNEINFLKTKGCPFYGRKTTIRWVRNFIALNVGAVTEHEPRPLGHRSDSAGNKRGERSAAND